MTEPETRPKVSLTGIVFMMIGVALIVFDLRSPLIMDRLGMPGYVLILLCGSAFSVWGLKELIAGFFPSFAGETYLFRLPREGAAYLVIMCVLFMGSLLGRNNLLLMVFSLMAGPFVMNGWFTFTMLRRLRVRREMPERVMAGDMVTVTMVLENRKKWLSIWLMTVHDLIRGGAGQMNPAVLFVRVSRGSEKRRHYLLRLTQRGKYEFGPVSVTTRFPLGLVERGVGVAVRQNLLVYPRLGRLLPAWRRQLQNSTELVSHLRSQKGGFNDEMHRIREYRPGDDPRMIHWRTSARMTELMVCDYHESRDRDLVLLVDAWLPESFTEEQHEEFERGLRFAATACMDYLHHSRLSSLTVRLFGQKLVDWRGHSGSQQADALLDSFAMLEPSHSPNLSRLTRKVDRELSRNRRVIVVTPRPAEVRKFMQENSGGLDVQVISTHHDTLSALFEDQ